MTPYRLEYTPEAADDLLQLYEFLADTLIALAGKAITVIESALDVMCLHPYICRKAQGGDLSSQWRELVINFGAGGYIALFQILDDETIQVAAVRHQRENDYH